MTESERYAEVDEMAAHAQRFAPARAPELTPAHLAGCIVPRRNLCAEFAQLPTDKLLDEAEALLVRLDRAGRPTDYAVVVALVRKLKRESKLDGSLWLDFGATV